MNLKKFVVDSKQALVKDFNGQQVSYDADKIQIGKSGETKLYNFAAGGGLFLRDDEVKAVGA